MKKNLLIITQKVDENDDLLGFFVGWIREFSKHFDRVFVIALAKGRYELPANVFVYSLGKEIGNSRFKKFIKFYWHLFRLVPKSSGIFAHMSPIFAVMSWPVAALFGKKIILWYLHRSVAGRLKLAEKLVYKIVTSTKESLNLKSKKIIELGHGINVGKFKTKRDWGNTVSSKTLNILSVGRISRIKGYETLIRAAAILRDKSLKFKIKIIGRPIMAYDFDYFEKLKKVVNESGLKDFIEFAGFVPYSRIADYYKKADIFINLAPTGGIDKVVLEAMASSSLVLVSNEAFKKYFGEYDLFFKHGGSENLAEKIIELASLTLKEAEDISSFLVESVEKNHNLEKLIIKLSDMF